MGWNTERALMPTKYGDFEMIAIAREENEEMPHIVLKHQHFDAQKTVTVRVHSECITGDLFGSQRCDCGEQLEKSLEIIARDKGVLIYLRQEGRGIGILNKLKAYNLQDQGMNTIEANLHLGFEADARDFGIAKEVLIDMGVKRINLITNNPEKIAEFDNSGIEVLERIALNIQPNKTNAGYLKTKKDEMGHLL